MQDKINCLCIIIQLKTTQKFWQLHHFSMCDVHGFRMVKRKSKQSRVYSHRCTFSHIIPASNNIKVSERAFNLLYFFPFAASPFLLIVSSEMSLIFAHREGNISEGRKRCWKRSNEQKQWVNEWKRRAEIHNSLFVIFGRLTSFRPFVHSISISHFNSSWLSGFMAWHGTARHSHCRNLKKIKVILETMYLVCVCVCVRTVHSNQAKWTMRNKYYFITATATANR